jgi:hypothetical protein
MQGQGWSLHVARLRVVKMSNLTIATGRDQPCPYKILCRGCGASDFSYLVPDRWFYVGLNRAAFFLRELYHPGT